jgi:hypothetical protein
MSGPDCRDTHALRYGGYELTFYRSGAEVPLPSRPGLAQSFDEIASTIWGIDKDFFRKVGPDLFTEQDRVVVVVNRRGKVVGFSISRRIAIADRIVLFRRYTAMYPGDQGRGLYGVLTAPVLNYESHRQRGSLYLAWRTRNPVVWFKNAAMCSRVAPNILEGRSDADLIELALAVCHEVYPKAQIDPATLTIGSVYPGDSGYRTQPRHPNKELDATFGAHPAIRNPHDALFGIGEVRIA